MHTSRDLSILSLLCLFACGLAAAGAQGESGESAKAVLGYIEKLPSEDATARARRHRRVARRREQDALVMLHRGATAFAPENTLEAYAAAMDHGADGVEIDVRRSRDGVLYLFHDDTLDDLTHGSGKGSDRTYYELLQCRLANIYGTANGETRIPTLAAFVVLARQRAILIHLDIKESEAQDGLIAMFDAADIWDHVVHVNPGNGETIRRRGDLRLHRYKGWIEEAGDVSKPDVAARFLSRPGKLVFCKRDPRKALEVLGRDTARRPVPLPKGIRKPWSPTGPVSVAKE